MTFDTSLDPGLLLVMSSDGKRILSATYSSDQVAGVLVLVIVSCFSLIAVMGLLVLMAVGIYFPAGFAPLTNALFFTVGFCVVQ